MTRKPKRKLCVSCFTQFAIQDTKVLWEEKETLETLTYYPNLNGFVLSLAVLLKKFQKAFASKTFSGS